MATKFQAGDKITYPATAFHGALYPDFTGTVVAVTASGYLKVRFDALPANDIRTVAPADIAA